MNTRKTLMAAAIVVLLAAAAIGAWVLRGSAQRASAVAATVNGEAILWSQVDSEVGRAATQFGIDPTGPEFAKQRAEISKAVVDQLIGTRLVMQEARRRNIVATDREVEEQLAEVRKRFPSDKEFEAALARNGFTLPALRDVIRANLTQRRVASAVVGASVSEDEIRKQYESKKAQYDQPAQIRVSHILFRIADKSQESLARAKARIAQAKLADGAKFEDVAKQYSDDTASAQQGGELGLMPKGRLVKEFEDVAWSLKPGQTSEPVRTQFGLHIIRVHEIKEAQTATYDGVKDQIRQELLSAKQEKGFEAWVEQQRKTAKIERFDRP